MRMEVTEEEREMLEVVRDHEADATSDFRLHGTPMGLSACGPRDEVGRDA